MKTDNNANLEELLTVPEGKLLWRYSLPAVVGMLVMQLYNIVDRAFIGHVVGAKAIAGLAITFPVMNISTALGVLIGAGASARLSIMLGNGDTDNALKVFGNALTLTLLIGVAYISVFAWFLDDLLMLFGATEATLPYASDFMKFILPGLFMMNLTFSFNNLMRASGYPVKAMVTMFIGAGLNIALAPLFIYVLGLGIKGAAIATDISMAVSTVFVMAHFVRNNGNIRFKRGIYRLDRNIVAGIVAIGAAPSIVNVASCLINILINKTLLTYGGDDAIASAGVFVTFTSVLVAVIIGICQGMQPIIGYNYGAGRYDRLKRTFWYAVGASTAVSGLGWVLAMVCPQWISLIFIPDAALVADTAAALSISMVMFWMVGFQIISTTLFQSIGKAGKSIFLSLTRQVIFLIPLMLILPKHFGLNGIWASFPSGDLCATTVTAILVFYQLRAISRQAHKTKARQLT